MTTATDKNHVMLVLVESTFNTPVNPSKDLGLVQTFDPRHLNNVTEHFTTGARQAPQRTVGKYEGSVDVTCKYQHGRVFSYFFGAATTDNTTGDYRHVYVDLNNDVGEGAVALSDTSQSFSMEDAVDLATDAGGVFAGCKFGSLTLASNLGEVLTWSGSIIASSFDAATSAGTKVVSTIPVFEHFKTTISTGTEGAEASQSKVQDFSITFNNNLEAVEGLGSRENQELVENQLQTSFSFTMTFENNTELQRFLGGTTASTSNPTSTTVILDVNNGVTLGSGRRAVYVKLEECQYDEHNAPKNVNQKVMQTFTGTGKLTVMYDISNIADYNS